MLIASPADQGKPSLRITGPTWGTRLQSRRDTPSSRNRLAKYQFETEGHLVQALCDNLSSLVPDRTFTEVHLEWAIGSRIADLCLAVFRQKPCEEKILRKLARQSLFDQAILARTVSFSVLPSEIAKTYFLPISKVEESLQRLFRAKLIVQDSKGGIRATEWRNHLPDKVQMIEAKLEDWQGAIHQASLYRPFSDTSWVAMPEGFASHVALHERCFDLGLGLLLVRADGTFLRAAEPAPPEASLDHQKMQTSIRLLRRFVLDSEHAT